MEKEKLVGQEFRSVKKEVKKKHNYRLNFALILTLLGGGSFFYTGLVYARWKATHEFQFPVKSEWIGITREIKPEPVQGTVQAMEVKELTDMEIIEQYKLAPVLKSIYLLESTSGENDGCKDKGEFNGYGYGQNSSAWNCYTSFEVVTELVNKWFESRLAGNGNNIMEAVCFYNRGIQGMSTCGDYSENFASVLLKFI